MHSESATPTKSVALPLFASKAFRMLPEGVQELARTALHAIHFGWGDPRRRNEIDYAEIAQMINACLDMIGPDDSTAEPKTRLLALDMRIIETRDALLARWPCHQTLHNEHVYMRGIEERLLASMAIWYIELAMRALNDGDAARAINEIAKAGLALHLCGAEGQESESRINTAYRRTTSARHAANASHAAHTNARQTARVWYAAHKPMKKDDAAQRIKDAGIVHASFRTIRGYLIGQ